MGNKTDKNTAKSIEKLNTPKPSGKNNAKSAAEKSKLKKPLIITAIVLAAILILTLILVLIFQSSPIGRILTRLQKSQSYQMSATVSGIPFLGSLSIEQSVDENVTYTPASLISAEHYRETVGDEVYVYKKDTNGNWTKSLATDSDASFEDIAEELIGDIDTLTNPRSYEKVKGEKNKYKQKDDVEFAGYRDVVITIGENEVTVEMTMDMDSLSFPATVIISKIGEVELTLPEIE